MRKTFGELSRKGRKNTICIIVLEGWATDIALGIILFLYSRLHVCVTHQRKMKAIRKSLENYLEKKLEELMGRTDKKNKQDFGIRK